MNASVSSRQPTAPQAAVPAADDEPAVSTVSFLPAAAGPGTGAPVGSAIGLYARPTPGYEQRVAHTLELLRSAAAQHPGTIVQATSLGAEDMVVTDLIARHQLPIALATLETGMLHAETVALVPRIRERYGLDVQLFKPVETATIEFVRTNGDRAMYQSIALRKACCGVRKLEPLARMLAGRTAWITGLRREQSNQRGGVPFSEADEHSRTKLNPLADWSWSDVWHYIAQHQVPYNPLHDQFMPSIGCAPCTRAIAVGEEFRSGRWWWESESMKECGLHVKPHSAGAPAPEVSQSETSQGDASVQADFGNAEVKDAQASGRNQDETAKECGLHVKQSAEGASA
jgi:phosphoadenosine phosphosulfate reductase